MIACYVVWGIGRVKGRGYNPEMQASCRVVEIWLRYQMSWWVFVVHMPGGWQCSCSVVPGCLASVKYLPRGFDYPPANSIEPSAGLIFDLLWVRSPRTPDNR